LNADEIKALRIKLDLTQEKFGALLGVTKSCVQHWEYGFRNPSSCAITVMKGLGR